MPIGTSDGQYFENEWDMHAAAFDSPGTPNLSQGNPFTPNFNDAVKNLGLNEQEQNLYQTHLSNLYGDGGVNNPDGSRSTLYQMSVQFGGENNPVVNLPTVYDGKILNADDAIAKAKEIGLDKFPSYPDTKTAEDRYDAMHQYMEKDTSEYLQGQKMKDIDSMSFEDMKKLFD